MGTPSVAPNLKMLGDFLLEQGLVSREALARGDEISREGQIRLPAALTRLGLLSEKELADALSALLQVETVTRDELLSATVVPGGLNLAFLRAKRVIPLTRPDSGHDLGPDLDPDSQPGAPVDLAMADPLDDATATSMGFALGRPIRRLVAEESDIDDALAALASAKHEPPLAPSDGAGGAQVASDLAWLDDRDSEAPIIRLVSRLIAKAVTLHASDIHVEPQVDALIIRFRVDGNLGEQETLSRRFADPVVSRIKLMAKLDIAEKRLPQDGRIQTSVRGNSVDLRIATFPTLHGESLVLRLLGQQDVELALDRIGLSTSALTKLRASLRQPNGLILITGPTGSGKTTTLYAALNAIRTPESKLVTVEDPIEFTLPGIAQLQVKQEIGLTFSSALRSVLRNDPDIIMVGEIRDKETADIAIRAALTGHLVLATLHTNTAAGAITRLLDLGVEDYLLASVLLLTSAQRLVRRLCGECSDWAPITAHEATYVQGHAGDSGPITRLRKAHECPACNRRGFSGRLPLFEAIAISASLRTRIQGDFDEFAFQNAAVAEGTQTLFDDGLNYVVSGVTTLDELLSAVGS